MAYNIVKTDGTPLVTVPDGQTNSTATSLTLVGKNFAGYGTFVNENLVQMLENWANSTAPNYPMTGQLWYQTSTKLLQVYNGNAWKSISGAQNQADEPVYKVAGDLWFDSVNQQLKCYTGATWIVIGPSFTSTTGTSGAVADTVIDSNQSSHVVVKFYVQNQLVGILSKDDAFTPGTSIPGFSTVQPGFNLAQGRSPDLLFYQTANNAAYLGGVIAAKYITQDNATLSTQLIIKNPLGLQISETGGAQDAQLYVSNNNIVLYGQQQGNGFTIVTKPSNNSGNDLTVLAVDKITGLITVSGAPTADNGIATKLYTDSINNTLLGYLQSNVAQIYGNISTTLANTTQVYGNVRALQANLGFNVTSTIPTSNDVTLNISHNAAYEKIGTMGGTTFAGNLLTLWANVALQHANILSNTGTGGTSTSSMYGNVIALQGRATNLENNYVQRSGGVSTITGNLTPDGPSTHNLGEANARFNTTFTNSANVLTITNLASINATGNRSGYQSLRIEGNPLYITGNINFVDPGTTTANTAMGFTHAITVEGGVVTNGAITTKGADTYDIGASSNRFNNIYVKNISADTISGAISGGNSSFGFTQFGGNINPTLNITYTVGDPVNSKYWKDVAASTFTSNAYTSLTATGLRWQGSTEVADIGTSSIRYASVYAVTFAGKSITIGTGIGLTGSTPSAGDIGTSANKFTNVYATTFYGQATSAQYADLAERFACDMAYTPGTLVCIGGVVEITQELRELSEDVLGVISTNPAYLMNRDAGGDATHPAIALNGRVPVRVVGLARKGDRLVSAGNGCARAATKAECTAFNVIGRALADKTVAEEALLEAIVKVNI